MEIENRIKVGLITYHAAYNFGSVLQAYATQKTIEDMGYPVEMIDYRTPSQTLWYSKDIAISKGIRSLLEAPAFLHIKNKRKIRAEKFKQYIIEKMHLSDKKYTRYEDFADISYDILVSGSDQIWNYGCGEFRHEPFDAIRPYLLDFGNPNKRIAYASSLGPCTPLSVKRYIPYIQKYDYLSTREPIGKRYIEMSLDKNVNLVCDPTWLLDKKEWSDEIPKGICIPKKPYLLIYSLSWTRTSSRLWLDAINKFARKNGLSVHCISPLHPLTYPNINMIDDAGPLDFLALVKNASLVITNTFHGTIFAINFEVPFFSCQAQPGSRQGQILEMCGLEDRIVNHPHEFLEIENPENMNFLNSTKIIEELRKESKDYLKHSLEK